MKKKLSEKEKLFCLFYCFKRNAREAASKSGYRFAEKAAAGLLERKEIRAQIANLSKALNEENEVSSGYRRLAFGNNSDALELIFCSEPTKMDFEKLDLFGVSEIRKQKDGSIEVKFFDRLKALEKLDSFDEKNSKRKENDLYSAIEKSAAALSENANE